MSAKRECDVLIAGAGMVGAGLAACLATGEATRRLRIALVDPNPALPPLPGEPLDIRVSAVSRAGERLLRLARDLLAQVSAAERDLARIRQGEAGEARIHGMSSGRLKTVQLIRHPNRAGVQAFQTVAAY